MQENNLTISIGKDVIVTDEKGHVREGKVMNHDNGRYLVNFPGSIMNEFWSPAFVKEK